MNLGRSAGIRTRGLLVPKIGLKIQSALSGAFGAVCYGRGCFSDISAPMLPSAPGVVWVSVWVRAGLRWSGTLHEEPIEKDAPPTI